MRHSKNPCNNSAQISVKEEMPNLSLVDCDLIIKNDFTSDDEMGCSSLNLDINHCSDSDDDMKNRRRRRKCLAPQRAIQLEVSQTGSLGNSSESSQDLSDNIELNFIGGTNDGINDFLLNENDNGLDLPDGDDILQDINEDDIFKDLQEEADGEKLDEEMLDNVKEEWRAHWGIKCNMCEQIFPYKTEFDKHYQDNYCLIPVYTCSFCNKTVEKYSTFRSHCYRHITEGRYKCQACPKGFSLQSMLHVHVLAKHTKAKPYMCDECGKSFVTNPGLKIHLKKHKTENKEDYPCVECGKILHTRGGLTSHMNVHRLGRRFMCDVCGKTFTQKVNMQQHVKQHTGDKPHGCDKCGKTFAERSHLVRHYSFHSDQRPFKCEVCQKMYKTERCLKVHSLVHAAARPFVCDYCGKGFLSSTKLKQHYNIHTGERPYKCRYCERTFTNYPNWLKHTRRRHKVDHKTGEELISVVNKKEKPKITPITTDRVEVAKGEKPLTAQMTDKEEISAATLEPISDLVLTKNEELFIQQGLFNNIPISDDKFLIPALSQQQYQHQPQNHQQQHQFDANPSTSMGMIIPYFQPNNQNLVQNAFSTATTIQFNELIHTQYLQQPLL